MCVCVREREREREREEEEEEEEEEVSGWKCLLRHTEAYFAFMSFSAKKITKIHQSIIYFLLCQI